MYKIMSPVTGMAWLVGLILGGSVPTGNFIPVTKMKSGDKAI